MCFSVSTKTIHVINAPKAIQVYKIVDKTGFSIFGVYRSEFLEKIYWFWHKWFCKKVDLKVVKSKYNNTIAEGYHSYEEVSDSIINSSQRKIPCIIPKGAEYYYSNYGNIKAASVFVSNRILVNRKLR